MGNRFDSLGDRMKGYESVTRSHLIKRVPVIIRVDGCAFHTLTHGMEKPFDEVLFSSMIYTATELCRKIQGVKLAYVQSDEISFLLTDYEKLNTGCWLEYVLSKVTSVSSALATLYFNKGFFDILTHKREPISFGGLGISYDKYLDKEFRATFDSRAFNLHESEVCNYFIWRQQDAVRNSISSLAQSHFSPKQLYKKSSGDILQMLKGAGIYWDALPYYLQRGAFITKRRVFIPTDKTTKQFVERSEWRMCEDTPVFSLNRNSIEQYMVRGE